MSISKRGSNGWVQYCDAMIATGKVTYAAIIGRQDGNIYAISPEFSLTVGTSTVALDNGQQKEVIVDEYGTVIAAYKSNDAGQSATKISMNGIKYIIISWSDDGSTVYLKSEKGGACIVRTKKLFIIGVWSTQDNLLNNGGSCNMVVEEMAESFMSANY